MGAGKYNQIITIEQRLMTTDNIGQSVETWATFRENVWANIQYKNGKEYFGAKQNIPELDAIITIRYLRGLRSTMRIKWGIHYLQFISKPIPKGRNLMEELEIHCKEVFA
jgi:SPP1 family predicted phage head-tail adaptor